MERINSQEDLIKRYLLGELSAAEQVALEDEYFGDESKYDRLCKAEDELLDRYTRDTLSEADRERFERSYLTNPWRRRRVMFARAFTQVIDENLAARRAAPQTAGRERIERHDARLSWLSGLAALTRRGPRFALSIAAALLIGLGGAWLVIETSRMRAQLSEALREGETQAQRADGLEAQYRRLAEERDRLQAQLEAVKENASPTSRATPAPVLFALSISAYRNSVGQEDRELIIPRDAEEARLRIDVAEHEFPSYQVMLLTADGKEVFVRKGLRPQATRDGDLLIVTIPARKFASGENVLAFSGISAAGELETLGKAIVKVRRR